MNPSDIKGRVALVTGASRGIGSAIAAVLAAAGASVAVNYRERRDEALGVVARLQAQGARAIAVRADVSNSAEVAAMHREVRECLGAIDILVNNAGRGSVRGLDELDEAEFDLTLAVNLKSAFLCTQAVIPDMRAGHWGRIVNVSSVAARSGGVVGVHYNASKAGLEGLTRGYAAQLARDGITVNAVAPGMTDTEMAGPLKAAALQRIPVGRLGTPEEMAQGVLMLVANGFVTGQSLQINGGSHFA